MSDNYFHLVRCSICRTVVINLKCFFKLTEIQAHYDEVQRQLQVTLDQYGIAQRRLQSLTGEIEEVRGNYESVSYPYAFICY